MESVEEYFFSSLIHSCTDSREAVHRIWKRFPEYSRLTAERYVQLLEKKLTAADQGKDRTSEPCATRPSSNGDS
jgi:hypothetical protein